MRMTKSEYDERKARIENGTHTDEDTRLVDLYRDDFENGKLAHDEVTSDQQQDTQAVGITGSAEAEVVPAAKKTTAAARERKAASAKQDGDK